MLLDLDQLLGLGGGGKKGLLDDDVLVRFERGLAHVEVRLRHCANNDDVDIGVGVDVVDGAVAFNAWVVLFGVIVGFG